MLERVDLNPTSNGVALRARPPLTASAAGGTIAAGSVSPLIPRRRHVVEARRVVLRDVLL